MRRVSAWILLVLLVVGPVSTDLAHAQVIADGRTQTEVTTDGHITHVTTQTVYGESGVNSFSELSIAEGGVVNLHLPVNTSRLVNLVHGSATEIHGMLNSIKEGAIGGKVYILNPHGIVIGPKGTVNVGELSLMTPDPQIMSLVYNESDGLSGALLDEIGAVPLTPSGNISVAGTINALTNIQLAAQHVTVDGEIVSGAVFQHVSPDFSDVVNLNGVGLKPDVRFENGAVRIHAGDSFTGKGTISVDGDFLIDAGHIEITAGRLIELQEGAQLLAQAGAAQSEGGDVTLRASQTDDASEPVLSDIEAETRIVLDGATIKARNITIAAEAGADNSWNPDDPRDLLRSTVSLASGIVLADVNVIRSRASSEVVVKGETVLSAISNVSLSADSKANTGMMSLSPSSLLPVDIGVAYGELTSRARVHVGDGVKVSARFLDVSAHNVAGLDVSVTTLSLDRGFDSAVAVTKADVSSEATIASGAHLDVSNIASISAVNENSFSTSASALSLGEGKAGVAVAYFHADTQAVATLDADLPGVLVATVEAADLTERNVTRTSTSAGSSYIVRHLHSSLDNVNMGRLFDRLMGRGLDDRSSATEQPKFASSVSVVESAHKAWANVGDGATINADYALVVSAEVKNAGIQNHATSSVETPGNNDPKNPDASVSVSAAVAYGDYAQDARAWIGDNATLNVGTLGLRSRASVPYEATWYKWEGLTTITEKVNGNIGAARGFLTGFANATGESTKLGLVGAVTYLDFENTSHAYLGRGVTVTATGQGSWTTTLPSAKILAGNRELSWETPVAIDAFSEIEAVSGSGNLELTFQGVGGAGPDAVAVGGAYGQVNATSETKAFVSAGATIEMTAVALSPNISINARSREQLYLIAPTAGRGAGYGLSGNFALGKIQTVTEASVDRTASISAKELQVHAEDDVLSWVIAGAFNKAHQANVGAGIALQDVTTSTRAWIGENETAGEATYDDGEIRVEALSVSARTDGKIETISVAGSVAGESPPASPKDSPTAVKRAEERLEEGIEMATFSTNVAEAHLELDDAVSADEKSELPDVSPVDGGEKAKRPKFGLTLSGSVSYNNVRLTTDASIDGAKVIMKPAAEAGTLSVTAVNATHIGAFSGAAAWLLTDAGDQLDVALAGAAAVNEIVNTTEARVARSSLSGVRDAHVSALAGGDQLAIGIGAAYNGPGDADLALTVAGSVSVSRARNTVRAVVDEVEGDGVGDETQDDDGPGSGGSSDEAGPAGQFGVTAYNRTRIQSGAGSLAFGGRGGLGAAVTYNEVANTTDAVIRESDLEGFSAVDVRALTATRIATGGGSAGGTTDKYGGTLSGAFVITDVASATSASLIQSDVAAGSVAVVATDVGGDVRLDALLDAEDCEGAVCDDTPRLDVDQIVDFQGAQVRDDDTIPGSGSSIVSVAGVLQAGRSNAGISFSYNEIAHSVTATVSDSSLEASGDIEIRAHSEADIFAASAGIGLSMGEEAQFSGAGSVTVNKIRNHSAATVDGNGVGPGAGSGEGGGEGGDGGSGSSPRLKAASVVVEATDASSIWALAGQVSAHIHQKAIGLAIAHQDVANSTKARVDGLDITVTGAASVGARSRAHIEAYAMSGAFASGSAVGGSSVSALVSNTTESAVTSTAGQTLKAASLTVQSSDESGIYSRSGQLGGSREAGAAGAAVAVSRVNNATRSNLSGVDVTTAGAVAVSADDRATIQTVAASGEGGQGAAGSGSVAWAAIGNRTHATVDASGESTVTAASLRIEASDHSHIDTLAGQAAYSGGDKSVGAGAAVSYHEIANEAAATLVGTHVSGADTTVAGESASRIRTLAASAGVGGWGVSVGVSVSFISNKTVADVRSTGLEVAGLTVAAFDRAEIKSLATQLAAATEASSFGGAGSYSEIRNETAARLYDVNVTATDDVRVVAEERARIEIVGAGLGMSNKLAAEGSVASAKIANTTTAVAGASQGDLHVQAGRFEIVAGDESTIKAYSGDVAAGLGSVGLGAAVSVNRIANTTRAHLDGTGGGTLTLDDLLVHAATAQQIETMAAGAAGGVKSGVAGSSATNFIHNVTESLIDGGAQVHASHNVGVIAESHDVITNVAGAVGVGKSAVGLGISISVNEIGGRTTAAIRGQETAVTALGRSPSGLSVAEGSLAHEIDLGALVDWEAFDPTRDWRPPVRDLLRSETVRGVAVNASATHSVQAFTVNAGLGATFGVAGNTTTNIIKGTTTAHIDSARINHGGGGDPAQTLSVKASDHAYAHGIVGSLGIGGTTGAGVAVHANAFSRGVHAGIEGSNDVRAAGQTVVRAHSTQGVSSLAIGAGVGGAAGAGTLNLATFTGETSAFVRDATIKSGDLIVAAHQTNRLFYATPAVAFAATGGGAATVSVGVMTGSTRAYVTGSTIEASGAVEVDATSRSVIDNWSIGAAGSAGLTVAGNVVVNVIAQTTEGYLEGSTISSAQKRAESLSVTARDDVSTKSRAGALGVSVGGLGAGAAAAVTSIRNDTSARVDGTTAYTREDVTVSALATRDLETLAIAGALALDGSIGGVAAVTLIGAHLSGSILDELDAGGAGTLSLVEEETGGDLLTASDGQGGGNIDVGTSITRDEMTSINEAVRTRTFAHLRSSDRPGGTSAVVGAQSTLDAGRDVSVHAEERLGTSIVAGAGAGAPLVSIGGSVAVTRATLHVSALVHGSARIDAGRDLSVSARAGGVDANRPAVNIESYQGSAGIATIGAAVADGHLASNTIARVGAGATLTAQDGDVAVRAQDETSVSAHAEGYIGGIVAVGMVSAKAEKSGESTAQLGGVNESDAATSIRSASGGVQIASTRIGSVRTFARAGAGGVAGTLAAVISAATDGSSSKAVIGHNVQVSAPEGPVQLEAAARPHVEAIARGYGGAILGQLGSSEARAAATPDVQATVGRNGMISARDLHVHAHVSPERDQPIVRSDAEAAGVGLAGLAADAAVSNAQSDINVQVHVGSSLNIARSATFHAGYEASQRAHVSGIVAGLAAIGVNTADASHRSNTSVIFAETASGVIGGKLEVNAAGRNDAYASATSGSGGIAAGAAAKATTSNDTTTVAQLGSAGGLRAGTVSLAATHSTVFDSKVNTIKASIVGASGARADNRVRSQVRAAIGDGATISTENIDVLAYNESRKPEAGFSAEAGSGGFLDDTAVSSYSEIDHETRTAVGAGAVINITGDRNPLRQADFSAVNHIFARDKTRLDAGGAIEIAAAKSTVNVKRSLAEVSIGQNAALDIAGTLRLAASGDADVASSANAKTYGLASAAAGRSVSTIAAENTVRVGESVKIRADGDLLFLAGQDLSGKASALKAVARTDLYNKTAVPIETKPDADAEIRFSSSIHVAAGASLRSVGDISFIAHEGTRIADGKGVGTDLYREMAEKVANAFSGFVGLGDVSLKITGGSSHASGATRVHIDGSVHAGIHNQQRLVFDAHGNLVEQTEGISYEIVEENLGINLHKRLNQLRSLRAAYYDDVAARAAYTAEIEMILSELRELGYTVSFEDDDTGELIISDLVIEGLEVEYIVVADAYARSGDITVVAHQLSGGGSLKAPADTEIVIENSSRRFLRVNELVIEDRGGHVYFNGVAVSRNDEINAMNREHHPTAQLSIDALGSSPQRPRIVVTSTFQPGPGGEGPIPDIEIQGDIVNKASGGTLLIDSGRGSIKLQGADGKAAPAVSADSITLNAGRSVVQSYTDGFVYIGGDPKLLWDGVKENRNEVRNGTDGWISGGNVFISARYLVLNGTIQSGFPDWEIDLPISLQEDIDELISAWKEAGSPSISSPSDLAPYVLEENRTWTAYFNPETKQIVLDDLKVRGGHVELYGAILNTGGGNIRVMDGFGHIKVNNELGYDLVVNSLDTGDIKGIVRITDTARTEAGGVPITTTYVGHAGAITYEEWAGDQLRLKGVQSGRHVTYHPEWDLRYVWLTGRDFKQTILAVKKAASWFDFVPGGKESYDEWTEIALGDERLLPDGEYIRKQYLPYEFAYSVDEYQTSEPVLVDSNPYEVCNSWSPLGWCIGKRTYVVEDTYTAGKAEVYTHSLRADHPIPIEFIGYDSFSDKASIEIVSAGNILIAGTLENVGGNIRLEALNGASIKQLSERAVLRGGDRVILRGDSIGDALSAVRVDGSEYGFVDAQATYDIHLTDPVSDLRLFKVESTEGDVFLSAQDSITQMLYQSHPAVSGRRIQLNAQTGMIGTQVMGTDLIASLTVHVGQENLAGLRATASGDIHIEQSQGDLRLFRVESLAGDVHLDVAQGSMIDANTEEERDERSIAELLRLWDEMLLIGEGAEVSAQATIDAYVSLKQAEYMSYWAMRGVRPVFNDAGEIIDYDADPFDPLRVGEEHREEFIRLNSLYGETEYDPNWTYTLSEEERTERTEGAAWTESELANGLGRGILFKQTGSTETTIRQPNVIGRNVTLHAFEGKIGIDDGVIVIDGNDPDALKDEANRLALAAAEVDDIGVDNENNQITILQRRAVHVQASGELVVEAKEQAYIGSRAPLYVRTVEAGGSIRIKGTEGIYNVYGPGSGNHINVQGGTVLLEGGAGGIGTKESPLRVEHGAEGSLTARAEGDIYIGRYLGDLHVAEIFSRGTVSLGTYGSILDVRGDGPIAIQGDVINLTAGAEIGADDNPLALVVSPGGRLDAEGRKVFVSSPSSLNLGKIETMLQVPTTRITAAGDIVLLGGIKDLIGTAGRVYLTAGGDIELRGAVESFHVELTAGGAIRQVGDGGVVKADFLKSESGRGQELVGANAINMWMASNRGSESIRFFNTASNLDVVDVQQGSGGLSITSAGRIVLWDVRTSGAVDVTSHGGPITQFTDFDFVGKVTGATSLSLSAVGGIDLRGANTIRRFSATNRGGGHIVLKNEGPVLEVIEVKQEGNGEVFLETARDMVMGVIEATGRVRLRALFGAVVQTTRYGPMGRVSGASDLTVEAGRGIDMQGPNTVGAVSLTNGGFIPTLFNNEHPLLVVWLLTYTGYEYVLLQNVGRLQLGLVDPRLIVYTKDDISVITNAMFGADPTPPPGGGWGAPQNPHQLTGTSPQSLGTLPQSGTTTVAMVPPTWWISDDDETGTVTGAFEVDLIGSEMISTDAGAAASGAAADADKDDDADDEDEDDDGDGADSADDADDDGEQSEENVTGDDSDRE